MMSITLAEDGGGSQLGLITSEIIPFIVLASERSQLKWSHISSASLSRYGNNISVPILGAPVFGCRKMPHQSLQAFTQHLFYGALVSTGPQHKSLLTPSTVSRNFQSLQD
ncbi:hypothetical protein ABKN59_003097 [Abortiporus biennis]